MAIPGLVGGEGITKVSPGVVGGSLGSSVPGINTSAPTIDYESLIDKAKSGNLSAEEKAILEQTKVEGSDQTVLEAVEMDESNRAEFEASHTQVGPEGANEWVTNESFGKLSIEGQTELKVRGVTGYNDYVTGLLSTYSTGEGEDKKVNLVDALKGGLTDTQLLDFGFSSEDITSAETIKSALDGLTSVGALGTDNSVDVVKALDAGVDPSVLTTVGVEQGKIDEANAYRSALQTLRDGNFMTGSGNTLSIDAVSALEAGVNPSVLSTVGVSDADITSAQGYLTSTIKLSNGDRIQKSFYDSLSEADKTLLMQVGVEQFNAQTTVTVGPNKEVISRSDFSKLSSNDQAVLTALGVSGFQNYYSSPVPGTESFACPQNPSAFANYLNSFGTQKGYLTQAESDFLKANPSLQASLASYVHIGPNTWIPYSQWQSLRLGEKEYLVKSDGNVNYYNTSYIGGSGYLTPIYIGPEYAGGSFGGGTLASGTGRFSTVGGGDTVIGGAGGDVLGSAAGPLGGTGTPTDTGISAYTGGLQNTIQLTTKLNSLGSDYVSGGSANLFNILRDQKMTPGELKALGYNPDVVDRTQKQTSTVEILARYAITDPQVLVDKGYAASLEDAQAMLSAGPYYDMFQIIEDRALSRDDLEVVGYSKEDVDNLVQGWQDWSIGNYRREAAKQPTDFLTKVGGALYHTADPFRKLAAEGADPFKAFLTTADFAATMFVPFYGTGRHWKQMSTGWKVGGLLLDAAMALPVLGYAAKTGATALKGVSIGAEVEAMGGRAMLESAVVTAGKNVPKIAGEITEKGLALRGLETSLGRATETLESLKAAAGTPMQRLEVSLQGLRETAEPVVGSTAKRIADAEIDVKNLAEGVKAAREDLELAVSEHTTRLKAASQEVSRLEGIAGVYDIGGRSVQLGSRAYSGLTGFSRSAYAVSEPLAWAGGTAIGVDTVRNWNKLDTMQRVMGIGVPLLVFGVPQKIISGSTGMVKSGIEMATSPGRVPRWTLEQPEVYRLGEAGMPKTPIGRMTEEQQMAALESRDIALEDLWAGKGSSDQPWPGYTSFTGGEMRYKPVSYFQRDVPNVSFSATPMGDVLDVPILVVKEIKEPAFYSAPWGFSKYTQASAAGIKGGRGTYITLFSSEIKELPTLRGASNLRELQGSTVELFGSGKAESGLFGGFKEYRHTLEPEFVNPVGTLIGKVEGGIKLWTRERPWGPKIELQPHYVVEEGARRTGFTAGEAASLKLRGVQAEIGHIGRMISPYRGIAGERTVLKEFTTDLGEKVKKIGGSVPYLDSLKSELNETLSDLKTAKFYRNLETEAGEPILTKVVSNKTGTGSWTEKDVSNWLIPQDAEGNLIANKSNLVAITSPDSTEKMWTSIDDAIELHNRQVAREIVPKELESYVKSLDEFIRFEETRLADIEREALRGSLVRGGVYEPLRAVSASSRDMRLPTSTRADRLPVSRVSSLRVSTLRGTDRPVSRADRVTPTTRVNRIEDTRITERPEDGRATRGVERATRDIERTTRETGEIRPSIDRPVRSDTGEEITKISTPRLDLTWPKGSREETGVNYALTVEISPRNRGYAEPEYEVYGEGEFAQARAISVEGTRFVRWKGDIEQNLAKENPVTIRMDRDRHLIAVMSGVPKESAREMPELFIHLPELPAGRVDQPLRPRPVKLYGKTRIQKKWHTS